MSECYWWLPIGSAVRLDRVDNDNYKSGKALQGEHEPRLFDAVRRALENAGLTVTPTVFDSIYTGDEHGFERNYYPRGDQPVPWSDYPVTQLRTLCAKRGLPATGGKQTLIDRLEQATG